MKKEIPARKDRKLLILAGGKGSKDFRIRHRIERTKVLNRLSSLGAKVLHDSGGRLIVIETPKTAEKTLMEHLPNAKLVGLDAVARESIGDLDPTESLFLEALKIRTSKSYREAKKRRKFGQTPEEKELFKGSCVREEY